MQMKWSPTYCKLLGSLLTVFFGLGIAITFANGAMATPQPTPEGNLLVNTLEDELNTDGDCSLREAIEAANTNASVDACPAGDAVITDTITFEVPGTITVTSQLSVTAGGPLVVDGGRAINVSGGGMMRVWWVETGSEVTLQRLWVVNGTACMGGAIRNEGRLTIIDSIFSNNTSPGEDCDGGAIANIDGTLTVTDSTLSGNTATDSGGAIYNNGSLTVTNSSLTVNYAEEAGGAICSREGTLMVTNSGLSGNSTGSGGAIANFGTLAVTNSSLSGNNASFFGGAIYNHGIMLAVTNSTLSENYSAHGGAIYDHESTVTIANSTLSGNSAHHGGAVDDWYSMTTLINSSLSGNSAEYYGGAIYLNESIMMVTNSIVANSLLESDCNAHESTIIDGGHNISSDDSCGFSTVNGSMPNTDPRVGPLKDNGGPTWTHALLEDSPGIDAGDEAQCPETDQRGVSRPVDGNGDGEAVCDIGSFEVGPGVLIVTTLEDELNTDGDCSLREAIEAANTNAPVDACLAGDAVIPDTITFEVAGTITVTSQLSVTAGGPLEIYGGEVITFSGGGTRRVLWVETGSELTLQHLAVIDGFVNGGNGGGLYNEGGSLTIIDCTLSNNDVSQSDEGGGAVYNEGDLTIIDSSLVGNRATINQGGGGIYNTGTLSLTNSMLSGNVAENYGGAIINKGAAIVTKSSLSEDIAYEGGAIYNEGVLNVNNSNLSENSAQYGGAISNHGQLSITDNTLSGNLAFYGGGAIYNNETLTVDNNTLSGNYANSGGAIYIYDGSATLSSSSLSGNNADGGGAIYNVSILMVISSTLSGNSANSGGGIYNDGVGTVTHSTLSENSAAGNGGAIDNSGGDLTVNDSTLSGNNADIGGAIHNFEDTITVINCTFSGNSAESGGAIFSDEWGDVTTFNTIVANSLSGDDCAGIVTDGGYNLDSDGTCGFDPANGSLPNTDPLLGPLHDNGGPTWTHELLEDSPAIDAGDNGECPETDQRGVARPLDGDGDGEAMCDIGSYEVVTGQLIVTTLEDELNVDGDCSLREAVEAANTNAPVDACPPGGVLTDTITFDVAGTITVNSQLEVTAGGPLVIDGGEVISVSGGETTRVFYLNADTRVSLLNLLIENGRSGNDHGGGILNYGHLVMVNDQISNNQGKFGGGISNHSTLILIDTTLSGNMSMYGGGIKSQFSLTIIGCTLSENVADFGGAILNSYGDMTVTNSTLSRNTGRESGGGIYNKKSWTVSLTNSTLSGNFAEYGGGIYIKNNYGAFTVTNSIIANSHYGNDCFSFYGSITDGGHNISSDNSCGFDPANGSMPNTDPMLGPLQDNGGPTWTHALLKGSPAIDAGDDAECLGTDQRGVSRPRDGDGDSVAVCDIGSYEYELETGVFLSPPQQDASANPADILEYTIMLYNYTQFTDTFSLALGPHAWETSLSTELIGPLASGVSQTFTVSVMIPPDAPWYLTDTVVITAASVTSPTVYSDTARITSQAYAPPDISLAPLALQAMVFSGEAVTRTLTISNGTGLTLTYTIENEAGWLSTNPASGEVGTSSSLSVLVYVDAAGLVGGVYYDILKVNSNDPDDPLVWVPVSILVVDKPITGLSASDDSPTLLGYSTTLTATITSGTNAVYTWEFGDGELGGGQVVTHVYPAVDVYTATVTATNSLGTATATTQVVIQDLPIEGLAASSDSPTLLGGQTTLSATVEAGTNVTYTWDFGDGETGSGQVVTHVYAAVDVYTATVTATNTANSLSETTVVTITAETPSYWQYLPFTVKSQTLEVESQAASQSSLRIDWLFLGVAEVLCSAAQSGRQKCR